MVNMNVACVCKDSFNVHKIKLCRALFSPREPHGEIGKYLSLAKIPSYTVHKWLDQVMMFYHLWFGEILALPTCPSNSPFIYLLISCVTISGAGALCLLSHFSILLLKSFQQIVNMWCPSFVVKTNCDYCLIETLVQARYSVVLL